MVANLNAVVVWFPAWKMWLLAGKMVWLLNRGIRVSVQSKLSRIVRKGKCSFLYTHACVRDNRTGGARENIAPSRYWTIYSILYIARSAELHWLHDMLYTVLVTQCYKLEKKVQCGGSWILIYFIFVSGSWILIYFIFVSGWKYLLNTLDSGSIFYI